MFDNLPILSILCYLPLLGAIPILWMRDPAVIRKYATGVVAVDFLLSLPLWFTFDPDGPLFQFVEGPYEWIPSIGVDYHFGIDGMALLLERDPQP
jgi:NADH-quinone oxidoreductase subunit M